MKPIPLIDLPAQIAPFRQDIDRAMKQVVDHCQFILGPEVKQVEDDVAAYCQSPYAIGVSSGTEALILSLLALDIQPGDGVLCPAFTYYATAGAVARAGGRPFFCDIDSETFNISTDSARTVLERSHGVIKAVIPVHLYGQCADMDTVLDLAKEYGLNVIEDTAQSFGACYKNKMAGTFGDCGTFSFFPGKNLGAFGDAGMIVTPRRELSRKLRSLRNQGSDPSNKYHHVFLGGNGRLDTLQAAILGVKLKHTDAWNQKRNEHARYYREKLETTDVQLPAVREDRTHVYHQFVLRSSRKENIVTHLHRHGVDARTYYPIPLHLQPCFQYLGYQAGDFPESEKAARETFAIPCYPELRTEQIDRVIQCIQEAL